MIEQINRIKKKLSQVKAIDKDLDVFGADAHEYGIGNCVTIDEVRAFEKKHNIVLPESYTLFVTQIGNGNILDYGYCGGAAGPYYGIFPFGEMLDELGTGYNNAHLANPCIVTPEMEEEQWSELMKEVYPETSDDNEQSDEEYYRLQSKVYGGLLPIGTQGCAISTALVLNGPNAGRIVYCGNDEKPIYAYESNFLDWYERWLDEIISGDLLAEGAGWFGYSKGGKIEDLWNQYKVANDKEEKLSLIRGLICKREISNIILKEIVEELKVSSVGLALELARLVAKYDYNMAKESLFALVEENLLHVVQSVYWYAKEHSLEWFALLSQKMKAIKDLETFNFCSYLLKETGKDYGYLLESALMSENQQIKAYAFYALGQTPTKEKYKDYFISGLQERDEEVLLYVLQSLPLSSIDEVYIPYLKKIAEEFKDRKEEYVYVNLEHILKEIKREDLLV